MDSMTHEIPSTEIPECSVKQNQSKCIAAAFITSHLLDLRIILTNPKLILSFTQTNSSFVVSFNNHYRGFILTLRWGSIGTISCILQFAFQIKIN